MKIPKGWRRLKAHSWIESYDMYFSDLSGKWLKTRAAGGRVRKFSPLLYIRRTKKGK